MLRVVTRFKGLSILQMILSDPLTASEASLLTSGSFRGLRPTTFVAFFPFHSETGQGSAGLKVESCRELNLS